MIAALLLGTVVPTLAEGSLTTGLGGGSTSSTGKALDPTAVLHGQLTLSHPIPLLRLDASVRDPGYLRAVTLDHYDDTRGWLMSNLDGEASITNDGRLEPLPPQATFRTVTGEIQAIGHADRFLPLLASPITVQMDGSSSDSWRFDQASGTVFGRGATTTGKRYWVAADEPRPSVAALTETGPLAADDLVQRHFTALPQSLDPRVTSLVQRLTGGATSPYARVRTILDYFTSPSNGFVYSLATAPGTGEQLPRGLPATPPGVLRAVRGSDGGYGAGGRDPGPGGPGVHPRHRAARREPGDHQQRRARLGGGLLRRAWLGALRPDADRRRAARCAAVGAAGGTTGGSGHRIRHRRAVGGRARGIHRPPRPVRGRRAHDRRDGRQEERLRAPPADRAGRRRAGGLRGRRAGPGAGSPAAAAPARGRAPAPVGRADRHRPGLGRRVDPAWTPRRTAAEIAPTAGERAGGVSRAAEDAVLQLARGEESACYGRAGSVRRTRR